MSGCRIAVASLRRQRCISAGRCYIYLYILVYARRAPLWMCIPPVRCTSVCVCVTPVPCQIRGHRKYSRQRAQAGPHPNMTHTDTRPPAQHRAPTRWGGQRRARHAAQQTAPRPNIRSARTMDAADVCPRRARARAPRFLCASAGVTNRAACPRQDAPAIRARGGTSDPVGM